jgi:hypothetical protein
MTPSVAPRGMTSSREWSHRLGARASHRGLFLGAEPKRGFASGPVDRPRNQLAYTHGLARPLVDVLR